MEENEQAFELERRCLSELQLAAKPLSHRPYYGYTTDELKLPEGLNFRHPFQLDVAYIVLSFELPW